MPLSAAATSTHVRATGVDPARPGPRLQRAGLAAAGDEVRDQVGAHALLGVGGGPLEEEHQGRDDRGTLEGPLVRVVELLEPTEHEHAHLRVRRLHADRPGLPVLGEAAGAGRLEHRRVLPQVDGLRRPGLAVAGDAEQLALVAHEHHPAAEEIREGGRDVLDAAALEHQGSEAVVGRGGALDARGVAVHQLVGRGQLRQGVRGLGGGPGLHDGHGGQSRERGQQGDLVGAEGAVGAVGGEQDAEELALGQQRGATDRHQALLAHGAVDRAGVRETVVVEVVGGPVGLAALGDQAAEAVAEGEPHHLELRAHRAVRRPHVGVAGLGVVERQVGDVGAEQGARPPDDGVEDARGVAQRGEVPRGVDQGGQLGLAPPPGLRGGPHPQGELPGLTVRVVDLREL